MLFFRTHQVKTLPRKTNFLRYFAVRTHTVTVDINEVRNLIFFERITLAKIAGETMQETKKSVLMTYQKTQAIPEKSTLY